MLEVNEYVNEYSDVEMYGDTFNKKDIVKNVEDKMILSVVGKLVRVWAEACRKLDSNDSSLIYVKTLNSTVFGTLANLFPCMLWEPVCPWICYVTQTY